MSRPKADLPYLEWTEPSSGAVVRLYADAITGESANLGAAVSQHAVESGSKVTDHYRKEPETVHVVYLFSGAPVRGDLDDENPGNTAPVALSYARSRATRRPGVTPLKYPPARAPGLAILNPFNAASAGINALASALGIGGLPKQVTPSEIGGEVRLPTSVQGLVFATDPAKRLDRAIETVRRLQSEGILVTVKTTFGRFPDCGISQAAVNKTPEMGTSGEITFELEQLRFVSSDVALALPIPVEPRALPKKTASAAGGATVDPKSQEASVAKKTANDYNVTAAGSGL